MRRRRREGKGDRSYVSFVEQKERHGVHLGGTGRGHCDHRRVGGIRSAAVHQVGGTIQGGGGVCFPVRDPSGPGALSRAGGHLLRGRQGTRHQLLHPEVFHGRRDLARHHREARGFVVVDPHPDRGVGRLRGLHRNLHGGRVRHGKQYDRGVDGHQSDGPNVGGPGDLLRISRRRNERPAAGPLVLSSWPSPGEDALL